MCTECHNLYKNSKASLCTPLENKTEKGSSLKGCANSILGNVCVLNDESVSSGPTLEFKIRAHHKGGCHVVCKI